MATSPMMGGTMGSDPENSADAGNETDQDSGAYSIEIEVAADGSITVSVESAATEGAESTGNQAEDESSAQPAKDFKDAMKIAYSIYNNSGEMPEAGGAEQDAADNAFGASRGGA